MRRALAAILAALAASFQLAAVGSTRPSGFSDTAITRPDGGAWDKAAGVAFAANGRMLVWERGGRVWLLDDARPHRQPVLDLSNEVSTIGALGLSGLALDPRFDLNGYVYLFYAVDPQHLRN